MPDNIPSAINNPFISEDSIFRMNLDTKTRFDNMMSNVQTPMAYQIAKSPDVDLYDTPRPSQSSLLDPSTSVGTIGEALFHPDVRVSSMAAEAVRRDAGKAVTQAGVGVPETFAYDKSMDKYLDGQFGYNPYKSVQDNEEYYYQNEWNQKGFFNKLFSATGTGLARFASGVALKTVQTAGFMGAMALNGIQEIFDSKGNNAMADISNNVISRWAEDMEANIKDSNLLAVFKPSGWEDRGFFDKLTHASFWSDEVADGAAFMGEMMLTSYLGGAAFGSSAKLSKLGQTLINVGKFGKAGKALDFAVKALTGAKDIGGIGRWAFMTTSESAMEASQQFQTKKQAMRAARERGENNLTDAEIDTKAGDAAASSFKDNMAILAISNAFENRFIFEPLFSKSRRALRAAEESPLGDLISISRKTATTEQLARASRSKYFGLIDKTSRLGFYGSRALRATAMEGFWEENTQLATERLSAEDDYQNSGILGRKLALLEKAGQQAWDVLPFSDRRDPEAETNIGLGGVIGIGGVVGTSKVAGGQRTFQGERRNLREAVDNAVTDYEKLRREFLSFNNIYDVDAQGNMEVNEEKFKGVLAGVMDVSGKQQMMDAVSDPLLKKNLQHRAMISYVGAAMAAGVMDKVMARFDAVESRLTGEELKELGFDPNTTQDPSAVIKDLESFAKIYQKNYEQQITPPTTLKKEQLRDWVKDENNRRYNSYHAKARAYSSRQIAEEYFLDWTDSNQVTSPMQPAAAESAGQVDEYNSLQFQLASLTDSEERHKGSDFYKAHFANERKRITDELKRLENIINNKITSNVTNIGDAQKEADKKEAEGEDIYDVTIPLLQFRKLPNGLIVSLERYQDLDEDDAAIQANFDRRSQGRHAQLTMDANINDFLATSLDSPTDGHANYQAYTSHLENIKNEDDKVDAATTSAKPAATAISPEAAPTSPTPTSPATPGAPAAATEPTEVRNPADLNEKQVKGIFSAWFLAIKRRDLAKIDETRPQIRAFSNEAIMKMRNYAAEHASFAPVIAEIDVEIKNLVGEEFFRNWMVANPVTLATKIEPEETPPPGAVVEGEEEETTAWDVNDPESIKKDLIGLLEANLIPAGHRTMIELDPVGYVKFLASQANNRTIENTPLEGDVSTAIREQVDPAVIDMANSLFPEYSKPLETGDIQVQPVVEEKPVEEKKTDPDIEGIIPHHTIESLSVVGAQFPLFNEGQHGFDDGNNVNAMRSHMHEVVSVHPSEEGPRIVVRNITKPGKDFPLGLISESLPAINREIDILNEATREKAEKDRVRAKQDEERRLAEQEKKRLEEEQRIARAQLLAEEPAPLDEIPPADTNDGPIWTNNINPLGVNPITSLQDDAKTKGEFVFDAVNPKEIEMETARPKVNDDGTINLKTLADKALRRQHNIMSWLGKKFTTDPEAYNTVKMKLEIISDDNSDWMYQRDERRNSIMSVLVDQNGKYLYFDAEGREATELDGMPFGVEYEDLMYNSEYLGMSRNMLATDNRIGSSVKHGFGDTQAPLMTIVKLLQNKVPVYGSVIAIMNGTLTSYNNRNNYNNTIQEESSYRRRSLAQLIEEGVVRDQFGDVRISGYYLDRKNPNIDQRIKIGRAYIYDAPSALYIPLIGRKLKDVTFEGTKIAPGTVLHNVIDTLDKKGRVSIDDKDDNGDPIIPDVAQLEAIGEFLKQLLWSKTNKVAVHADGSISLRRNTGREGAPEYVSNPLAPASIWEAEINYLKRRDESMHSLPIPTSRDEDTGEGSSIAYSDFMKENFETGAAQANVQPGQPAKFEKVNRRILFKLDDNHNQMLQRISTDVETITTSSANPQVGEVYAPQSDVTKRYTVTEVNDDIDEVTLVEDETQSQKIVPKKGVAAKWVKIDKIERPKPAEPTEVQKTAIAAVKALRKAGGRPGTSLSVTKIIRPMQVRGDFTQSAATIMGNVIDHMAKNIFMGRKVGIDEKVVLGKDGISGTLGSWFASELNFKETVDKLTAIRDKMLKDGYHFDTDIIVFDRDADISGEIDLVAISPEGEISIGDFKTSRSNFDDSHFAQDYNTGVTEREYFATQGYIYGLMLSKMTGLKVSDDNFIIGMPIVYGGGDVNIYDSKIHSIRDKENYVVRFPKTQIARHYTKEGTPFSSVSEIVKQYHTMKNQDSGSRTGRRRHGGGLEMSIKDINKIAATNAELKAEVEHMSEMFGEEFVVRFVNELNRHKYGEWFANGTVIYNNAVKGTVYHEGWHQFSQLFLSVEDKLATYQSLRGQKIAYKDRAGTTRNTTDDTDLDIEEMLADEWVKYVQAQQTNSKYTFPGKPRGIIGWFKNIWQMIKDFFSGAKDPNRMFKDLYNGNIGRYNQDVNNALWGNLNSSVLNDNGEEIINHTRINLYIQSTSSLIAKILRDNRLSWTWMRGNMRSSRIKELLWDELDKVQENILNKMDSSMDEVIHNPEAAIERTMRSRNISRELAAKYVEQIKEFNAILDDVNGGYNRFYDYYIRNSDLDIIRESADHFDEISNPFDTQNIKQIEEDFTAVEDDNDPVDGDDENQPNPDGIHGKGPNEESAYAKASKDVQDYFRGQPIVEQVTDSGEMIMSENELGIPYTYEYSSIFNKTKTILAGKFTIEDMQEKLANPYIQKYFPQAKLILEQLQELQQRATVENFLFIQKFIKVMALPEVDNKKLTVDFDASGSTTERTVVRMRSLSRSGEMQDIQQWQYQVRRPATERPFSTLGIKERSSINDVLTNDSLNNLFWNVDGNLHMNPFFKGNLEKMPERSFMQLLGIELNEGFWANPDSAIFASRFKEMFTYNFKRYQSYTEAKIDREGWNGLKMEQLGILTERNDELLRFFIADNFLANPIQQFRERRTYPMGQHRTIDTISLFPVMEDMSRQNSIYSPYGISRSFSDGSGKLKWPFYEPSMLAYRTELLNSVENIAEFDNNLDFSSINPNVAPWLRKTMFYRAMFDSEGKRKTISGDITNQSGNPLTEERAKIVIADLSSYETVSNRRYYPTHPKNLSASDKLFFDTLTLLRDGFIEIPRAATSSTVMAVKMNAYDARQKGDNFITQDLPIDINNGSVYNHPRFRAIMHNYLTGELTKLKWYFDKNPENSEANYLAHRLNIFADILDDSTKKKIISEVHELPRGDSNSQVKKMEEIVKNNVTAINEGLTKFFREYIQELYKGNNGVNYNSLSESQKSVLRGMTNLYENRARTGTAEEARAIAQVGSILEKTEGTSSFATSKEAAGSAFDESLNNIANIFAVNQFILNIEYQNWFMGDNYLFSNPFKRGNLSTNTGTMAVVSDYTNATMNAIRGESLHSLLTGDRSPKNFKIIKTHVVKEVKTPSRSVQPLVNHLLNFEKQFLNLSDEAIEARTAELTKMLTPYASMKSADGQAKISLDAYRNLRIIYGNWDWNTDEKEYQRQLAIVRLRKNLYQNDKRDFINPEGIIVTGREQDIEEEKKPAYSNFNPQKFSYTGPELLFDASGKQIHSPMRTKFDKMSLHPLIPEHLIGSGLPDEQLLIQMAEEDVDYVKMESAAKGVPHDDIVEFYDEYGNYKPGASLKAHRPEQLLSTYLKHQLTTDSMKPENTFGSQQRVMFFDVKYLPEVQNNPAELRKLEKLEEKYLNSVTNIMDFQRAQFYNRFGLEETKRDDITGLDIKDHKRFAAAVNSIAKSNNFPVNMMEYLKYDDANQQYVYDPSLMFNRRQLIDTIGGIIDKELRRLKTKGIAAIQVTSIGNSIPRYTNPTEAQIKEFGTNGLHYYSYTYNEDGTVKETSTMGIKITLQGDFKNLLNIQGVDGKNIRTLERLNAALQNKEWKQKHMAKLTFLGYRIPTNNNNFIDHVEIMEFLPESSGNIIIAPPEHIIKSGSDFDVDKMNFVFPSIGADGGMATLPTRNIQEIYDELNARTPSIPDYKMAQKLAKKAIKREEKDYKKYTKVRLGVEEKIRQGLFDIDSKEYTGLQTAGKSIYEIIDAFRPVLINYEDLQGWIKAMESLDDALGIADKTNNNLKVDREFLSLMNELAKYKDYHTNDMLEHMKATLRHPAYLRIMVTPSNTEYLSEQAIRIGELTKRTTTDNLSSSQNMKYTTVNSKHKEYLSDSKDLGLYSIQRRWFSLLNYSRMELNRDWQYGSKAHPMRILTPLAQFSQRDQLGDSSVIRVHGTNLDGMMVNDIWDQFMSLTIDLPTNTVYTLFGINKHNRKIAQYLTLSRYSVPSIMSFINQPILQEVYAKFEKETKNPANQGLYTLKHALIDVAKTRGIRSEGFNKLYMDYFDKGKDDEKTTPNMYVDNPGVHANKMLKEDTYFDQKDMDNDIEKIQWTDAAFKERQRNILLYFMTVNLEASNFAGMQFTFSDDRNKNTSYFTIIENNKKKEELRGEENDSVPLNGSMFSKEALTRLEKNSIYTPFNYTGVAKLFYEQFAKEFTNPNIALGIINLLNNTNMFGIDKQLLATRIEGDFIEFIYKNFGEFKQDIYDPFSDTLSPSTARYGLHFLNNIFNTTKDSQFRSYGDKLNKFLQNYPELQGIAFVQKLYPEGINAVEPVAGGNKLDTYNANVIRFRRSQDNTVSERNHYIKELESLVNFNPSEFKITKAYSQDDIRKISAFFTELSYLTLYQAGPTNIADNFSDLIPNAIWQQFSSKAFENYHKAIKAGKISTATMMKLFSMMYTQNNAKLPWKSATMIYDVKWYGEKPKDKNDKIAANRSRAATKYFNHFRAGKFYDLTTFVELELDYKGISDLTC